MRENNDNLLSYNVVDMTRFELVQTEPKSVVLPLHHISIKDSINIVGRNI